MADIFLDKPQAGARQVIASPVDGNIVFNFPLGDAYSSMEREGDSLLISFEDGSSLVLENFYTEYSSDNSPIFNTGDGQEMPAEAFFALFGEPDLMPAAGPGAAAAAAAARNAAFRQRGNLSMIDGIDRLDGLDIGYDWGQDPEEDVWGTREGGDIPTLDGFTLTVDNMYEDARPEQHRFFEGQGGDVRQYGKLDFSVNGGGGTVVDALDLGGFTPGTTIYFGLPGEAGTSQVTIGADGRIHLTADQVRAGVYVQPPADADGDMTVDVTVTIRSGISGITQTVSGGSFTVVVDAVADKAEVAGDATRFEQTESSLTLSEADEDAANQRFEQGWAKDDLSQGGASTAPAFGQVTVNFTTVIRFGDYRDGSERHFALVETPKPAEAWSHEIVEPAGVSWQDTVTLYFDAEGNCLGQTPVDGATAREFLRFSVSDELLRAQNGEITLKLDFSAEGRIVGGEQTLDSGAMALETDYDAGQGLVPQAGQDGELRDDNNVSYTFARESEGAVEGPNFVVDTIDSRLSVNVGWASEDNDAAKHGGPVGTPAGLDADAALAGGAPVVIGISQPDGKTDETMQSVKLYFDPAEGDIVIDGAVASVEHDAKGDYVTLSPGHGIAADGQSSSGVLFRPSGHGDYDDHDFSHNDISLDYEVEVSGPNGSSASFSGSSQVVMDAVADMPMTWGIDPIDYGHANNDPSYPPFGPYPTDDVPVAVMSLSARSSRAAYFPPVQEQGPDHSAAAPGDPVAVRGNMYFPDVSLAGNERHYILLNVGAALEAHWDMPGEASDVLSRAQLDDVLKAVGGDSLPSQTMWPSDGTEGRYVLIEVDALRDADGTVIGYTPYAVDADGNRSDLSGVVNVTPTDPMGSFQYELNLHAPEAGKAEDGSSPISVRPVAVVEDPRDPGEGGDREEYDYRNNIASPDDGAYVDLNVGAVTADLTIDLSHVFEDGKANQHLPEGATRESHPDQWVEPGENDGSIRIALSGASEGDYISSLLIDFKRAEYPSDYDYDGTFTIGDTVIYPNSPILFDADGNCTNYPGLTIDQFGDGSLKFTPNSQWWDSYANEMQTGDIHSDDDKLINIAVAITDAASGDTVISSNIPDFGAGSDYDWVYEDWSRNSSDTDIAVKQALDPVTGQPAGNSVIVDAVADRPEDLDANLADRQLQADTQNTDKGEARAYTIETRAVFGGDLWDDSEKHYMDLRGVPTDWTPSAVPAGWTLAALTWIDAAGVEHTLDISTVLGPDGQIDQAKFAEIMQGQNGSYSISFDVSQAATDGYAYVDGVVEGQVVFNPGDWTSRGAQDDADAGRWSDGSLNTGGDAVIQVVAVSEEQARVADGGELTDLNNRAEVVSTVTVSADEDRPVFTYDDAKAGQSLPFDDIIANMGMGEEAGPQSANGGGEFSFAGAGDAQGRHLSDDLSRLIKDFVARNGAETPNQNIPLGIQHADGSNSFAGQATASGRDNIRFDLHSDGESDGSGSSGAQGGKLSIAWAAEPYSGSSAGGAQTMPGGMYAKLTGESSDTESGYAELQFEVRSGEGGESILCGYFFNNAGDKVIALLGVISPDYANGTAQVTFVQYAPIRHPGGGMDNVQNYFKVALTDDDGDQTFGHVQMRVLDDVPQARVDSAAYDDHARDEISGNLLANDSSGSDGWKGDGWSDGDAANGVEGGNGVSSASVSLNYYDTASGKLVNLKLDELNGEALKAGKTVSVVDPLDPDKSVIGDLTLKADGSYSFTPARDSNVSGSFSVRVDYTVTDADGDKSSSALDIAVKGSAMFVGLSGDGTVWESTQAAANPDGSVNDAAGTARYVLQAYDDDGSALGGKELFEDVYVSVKLDFGSGSAADFDLTAIKAQNPTIDWTQSDFAKGELVIRIPAHDADGSVDLLLPLADDRYGKGGASDSPAEHISLSVTRVEGASGKYGDQYKQPGDALYAEHNVGSSQNTAIVDDGTMRNEQGEWVYAPNRVGEGGYSHDADAHPLDGPVFGLSASRNFVQGGQVQEDGSVLVNEGKTVYFTLSAADPNSASGADYRGTLDEQVVVKMQLTHGSSEKADLGNAQFEWAGGTNQNDHGPKPRLFYDADSDVVTITLPKGFDMAQLEKWQIKVPTLHDNLSERDPEESFTLAISGVTGNESSYDGSATATTIKDAWDNSVRIQGDDTVYEGANLEYSFVLNTKSALSASNNNTDAVTVTIRFGGSATEGKDFDIDAVMKFNGYTQYSVNADGSVTFDIPAKMWSNQGSAGDHTYTFSVPTQHDDQLGEADESVTITLEQASGAEIDPARHVPSTGTGTIEDLMTLEIRATDGNKGNQAANIHEDPAHFGKSAHSVAEYNVYFKHALAAKADGNEHGALAAPGAGDLAAADFSFKLALLDRGASFDANMLNNGTDGATGDYGWATDEGLIQYGDLSTADGKAALLKALNAELLEVYGKDADGGPLVEVTSVSDSGRTLTVNVHPGADLSRPMPIWVGAVDDRIDDNGEHFAIKLFDIQAEDKGHQNVIIQGNNKVDTAIVDDHNVASRDGFLVGLDSGEASESAGKIILPVVLFARDENGDMTDADRNNPPSQSITVTMVVENGEAVLNSDFYVNDDGSFSVTIPGGTGNWRFVEAQDGVPAHWVAVSDAAGIPLNDDRLEEGSEDFKVSLTGVKGHESELLRDEDLARLEEAGSGIAKSNDQTIVDDTLDAGNLDGPALAFFGAADPVREAVTDNDAALSREVAYKVIMDQEVAEDTLVFIDVRNADSQDFALNLGRVPGALGKIGDTLDPANGLYTLDYLKQQYPEYGFADGKGIDTAGGGYFVVIPRDSAEASFTVDILHDHDTAGDGKGEDSSVEYIDMSVTNIQGSENSFDKNKPVPAANSREEIQDDGFGPQAGVSYENGTLQVSLSEKADEDVTVRVAITDPDGGIRYVTATVMAGETTAELDAGNLDNNASNYVYTQVVEATGGEARKDSTTHIVDLGHGNGGRYDLVSVEITGQTIYEETAGQPSGVRYDLTLGGLDDFNYHPDTNLSFTIRPVNNTTEDADLRYESDGAFSNANDVTVELSRDFLHGLGKDGLTLSILPDERGYPAIVVVNGVEYTLDADGSFKDADGAFMGSIGGHMPTAFDDRSVEGDERFTPILVKPDGVEPVMRDPAPVTVIDNDQPVVKVLFVDADGQVLDDAALAQVREGGEVYVKVVLEDSDGNALPLGKGDAQFNLSANGSGALEGSDFSLEQIAVTVRNGESSSDVVKVHLPDDFRSDGDVTLTITATPDTGDGAVNHYGDFLPASEPGEVVIHDLVNGPVVNFYSTQSGVREDGSLNFWVTLDKALEEDAALTFKIDVDNTAADGSQSFTLDEVASIVVNGRTYTVAELGSDPSESVYLDADGDVMIRMDMANGRSKEGFKVNLKDDLVTENAENLHVSLVDTDKGELRVPAGQGGSVAASEANLASLAEQGQGVGVDVKVEDYRTGPVVSLVSMDKDGDEGESVSLGIYLSKETVSETRIVLGVNSEVLGDAERITVKDANGVEYETQLDGGTLTVVLPKGVPAGNLTVSLPLLDNAVSGGVNDALKVSLDSVPSGEASVAGGITYDSEFVQETNRSITFQLIGEGALKAAATATIDLSGIPGGADSIASLVIRLPNGSTTTVTDLDSLSYTLEDKASGSLAGTRVTINFKPSMSAADLQQAKLMAAVSGKFEGQEVTIAVNDDPSSADGLDGWDGPVFSVSAHAAQAGDDAGTVGFTIGLDADPDFPRVEDPAGVTLRFQLTGEAALVRSVSAADGSFTVQGPDAKGLYRVHLPEGYDLSEFSGELTLTLKDADARVAADHTLGVKLVDTLGGESSLVNPDGQDGQSSSMTIVDTAQPLLTIAPVSSSLAESAASAQFILKTAAGCSGVTQEATTVSFELDGSHADPGSAKVSLTLANGKTVDAVFEDGRYSVTLPKGTNLGGTNSKMGTIKVSFTSDNDFSANADNSISLKNVQSSYRDGGSAMADSRVTIVESGLKLALTADAARISEGGDLGFTLQLRNAATNGVVAQAMAVTLVLAGVAAPAGDARADGSVVDEHGAVWTPGGDHSWTVRTELDAATGSVTLHAEALSDDVIGSDSSMRVTVLDADADGQKLALPSGGLNVTVTDDDFARVRDQGFDLDEVRGMLLFSGPGGTDASAEDKGVVLMAASGEDATLQGGAGDDILLGADGDDVLLGGAGDDYLFGGAGENELYGGEGNDILVYSPDNSVMDGGANIDFLVGVTANGEDLDALLSGPSVQDVEVIVLGRGSSSLTSAQDFADLGLTASGDKLTMDDKWEVKLDEQGQNVTYGAEDNTYVEIYNAEDDVTILVQQQLLING